MFEGFIDFLSWLTCNQFSECINDYLILNTLAFLNRSKPVTNTYKEILLFLDNDEAGKRATIELIKTGISEFTDMSGGYSEFKDLNDSLINNKSCSY